MSQRVSLIEPEADAPPEAWDRLLEVLHGAYRPPLDERSLKVLKLITAAACDVRIRPGCFEMWPLRGGRHQYLSELAAPVIHHLLRRLGLSRAENPYVGVIVRVGLGAKFGKPCPRAVWLVPHSDELQLFLRDPPARGPRVAIVIPSTGPWALPKACGHPEPHWVSAIRACPHCKATPPHFREIGNALVCPGCGRSFDRRLR
jgi:hypothetical protein